MESRSRLLRRADISKKDAKVCVRIAGAGRRKTVETVTTWSSMSEPGVSLVGQAGLRRGPDTPRACGRRTVACVEVQSAGRTVERCSEA